MECQLNHSITIVLSTLLLLSCGESSEGVEEKVAECPTVINPVIIPAVRFNLFDEDKVPLNVCDAIITIENTENHQTIYGSALENCEDSYSFEGGYNLVSHNVLIEKAGFINQEFDSLLPIATHCSYQTLETDVYLHKD